MKNFTAKGSPPFINEVLSIDEWKQYVASYNFGKIPPSRVVLHHTWKPTVAQWRGLASMKGMQSFYRSKGWSAAPHLYVAPDGIWLATPMSEVGIHAGNGNSGTWDGKWSYSIGIEMVGNYDKQRPSGAVWEGTRAVIGELSKRLNIAPRKLIYFHRDFSSKSCPGWAVTKDWVFGEVEAYVNNAPAPKPPAPGKIGTPTPEQETLLESLLNVSYSSRAEGYTSEWAFHQYAVEHTMGMPLAKSQRIKIDGKEYNFQPFARDTLYCEIPKWGEVHTLYDLLSGSIPPSGLGRTMLEETFKAGGTAFHPEWPAHLYAISARLGPPIGQGGKVNAEGTEYEYHVFATDTTYNPAGKTQDIQLLSEIKKATPLREALLTVTYKAGGATYHADWAFHQKAVTMNIGTPISESKKLNIGSATYSLQTYALDTLYNLVPNWSDVKSLRDLARTEGMPSFAMPAFSVATEAVSGSWEPPTTPPHQIQHYAPASPAFVPRNGSPITMVIIHSDAEPAQNALERMTTIGARNAPHYYISLSGSIYQLVEEKDAAWHSGMATISGVWYNTNKISIGITLETKPDPEYSDQQLEAMRWLVQTLVERYHLTREDIVLASTIAAYPDLIPEEFLRLNELFG
jgi:N-acetyl-anhydromuramyl-L-alanine amidase AmpD